MKTERCHECNGHGVVSDYGPFGDDFYGPQECKTCQGGGRVPARDEKGRFVK